MRFIFSILLALFLIASCGKDVPLTTIDFGYDYYPSPIGGSITYNVDSIAFNDFTVPPSIDTFSFEVMEVYESVYLDITGDSVVRIEQFKRLDSSMPWQISHIASVKHIGQNSQKVENDLRFVKLVYPPALGKTWDGLLYLDVMDDPNLEYLDRSRFDWTHRYTAVHEPLILNGLSFDSTSTVIQIDSENLFEKKYSKEVYAKGVGLIEKELLILSTQSPPTGEPFLVRAEKGFILKYTIKDYQL